MYFTKKSITSSGSVIQGDLATAGFKIGVFCRLVSYIVSILSLVLIAVDRFIAVVFPLQVTHRLTRKTRVALLCATWLISITYVAPELYFFKVDKVGQKTFCRFAWNAFAIMTYYTVGFVVFLIAPLIAIIVFYSRIMRALRRAKPESHTKDGSSQQNERHRIKVS